MSSLRKTSRSSTDQDGAEKLRRGPWTLEEDSLLIHYISRHGEGRWNSLAKHAGLRRTGKSCRLRWLNYLKPDVKRGNLTPEEQFLILELHSKLGNRWSKIAQELPGRTDNEIKNYWRTRVQKQARHLKIDPNSAAFQNVIRCFWMPRLLQKMDGSSPFSSDYSTVPRSQAPMRPDDHDGHQQHHAEQNSDSENCGNSCVSSSIESVNNNISEISRFAEYQTTSYHIFGNDDCNSDALAKDCYGHADKYHPSCYDMETADLASTSALLTNGFPNPVGDCHLIDDCWVNEGFADGLWNMGF